MHRVAAQALAAGEEAGPDEGQPDEGRDERGDARTAGPGVEGDAHEAQQDTEGNGGLGIPAV